MNKKEFLRLSKEKQIEIMSEHDLESMDFKGLFETAKDKIKEDYTNATDTEYSDYVSDYLDLCCDEDEKEYVVVIEDTQKYLEVCKDEQKRL